MPTVAYITTRDKLLVFSHTMFPEAGIQVPAGTVEEGEAPDDAVMREAREETGLDGLEMSSFLGVREYDMSRHGRPEIQRRHFYHLKLNGEAPVSWRHYEHDPSGGAGPIEFELFWAKLPDQVPDLIAGQGELLASLVI